MSTYPVAYVTTRHSMPEATPSILIQEYDTEDGPGTVLLEVDLPGSGDLLAEDGSYMAADHGMFDQVLDAHGWRRSGEGWTSEWNSDSGVSHDARVERI